MTDLEPGMSELRISLHPTAVSQPCTNCGVHGGWSHAGRKGTFTPPPGHTLRDDGTIACPESKPNLRHLVTGTPEYDARQADLCAWIRYHGIDPDTVPGDAEMATDFLRRKLTVEVLALDEHGQPAYGSANRQLRRRITVDLIQTFDEFLATPR